MRWTHGEASRGRSTAPTSLGAPAPESDRPDLVWLLVGGIAIAGLTLTVMVAAWSPLPDAPIRLPWWAMVPLFYLVEVRVIHLQFQREAHSFTLSELPLVAGLFLAVPSDVILAAVLGSGLGLLGTGDPHSSSSPSTLRCSAWVPRSRSPCSMRSCRRRPRSIRQCGW